MKLSNLWSLATAEMRSCKRLMRTWVFIALAMIFSIATWIVQTLDFLLTSTSSPAAGMGSPRYFVEDLSSQILLFFTIGILFLTFDVRNRDIRDRIGEVMDIRPVSNIELLSGRLFGVLLLLTIPVFAVTSFIFIFGWVAETTGSSFGSLIEPISLISFLTLDVVPNLAFWGSLTYFFAIVLRYRVLVAGIVLALMVGMYFVLNNLPQDVAAALTIRGTGFLPSELAPHYASFETIVMRVVLLTTSAALLSLAAGFHPRIERNRLKTPQLLGGTVLILIAASGVFTMFQVVQFERQQFDRWVSAHAEHKFHSSTDIQEISGTVEIKPGKSIELDLTLVLNSAEGNPKSDWLISLNPGYHIDELHIDGTSSSDFHFENGLLTIPQTNSATLKTQVRLAASGMPNERFAYLDSAINPTKPESSRHVDLLQTLGQSPFVHHSKFVALMPDVYWLPTSGSAYGTTEWDATGNDFFNLDIQVKVPKAWLVAGPGRGETVPNGAKKLVHFKPQIPIRDLVLVASRFETFSTVVHDIEFELLLNKKHLKFLRKLEDIGPALNEWLDERIAEWKLAGLDYPFDTLSFVEVPVSLRTFGGGWRMDSVLAHPGVLMMRESGFPIARFDRVLENLPDEAVESEEKKSEYLLETVTRFFERDQTGGNPLSNLSKNFVFYQTMAEGAGSVAINYFINELAKLLVTGSDEVPVFSIYQHLNQAQSFESRYMFMFDFSPEFAPHIWHSGFTNRPSVWEHMSESSLVEIDYKGNPDIASRILFLRTNAIANQVFEHYGTEVAGALLAEIARNYRGSTFTQSEFLQTAQDVGVDFDRITGNWLVGEGLPGFMAANPRSERLRDSDSGESVYQTSFVLRNNEPVPGFVTVSYATPPSDGDGFTRSLPAFRVDGETSLRVAFQDSKPAGYVWITPEISLNRGYLQLDVPPLEDYKPTDSPLLPPIEEIDWKPLETNSVVVDDLDDGFTTINGNEVNEKSGMPWWLDFFVGGEYVDDTELDRGLPEYSLLEQTDGQWFRTESKSSHGKYRHTHVLTTGRSENAMASFETTLPFAGRWRLEYHLPSHVPDSISRISSVAYGVDGAGTSTSITITYSGEGEDSDDRKEEAKYFRVEVHHDNTTDTIRIEPSNAGRGWVELDEYDIQSSEVEVVVTPGTSGFTYADAVKWTNVESEDE